MIAMLGWSQRERNEAREKVLAKAGSIIRYVDEVACSYLKQPFQRPSSNRLKELPYNMNEIYSGFLRSLDPNRLSLLKTTDIGIAV